MGDGARWRGWRGGRGSGKKVVMTGMHASCVVKMRSSRVYARGKGKRRWRGREKEGKKRTEKIILIH